MTHQKLIVMQNLAPRIAGLKSTQIENVERVKINYKNLWGSYASNTPRMPRYIINTSFVYVGAMFIAVTLRITQLLLMMVSLFLVAIAIYFVIRA